MCMIFFFFICCLLLLLSLSLLFTSLAFSLNPVSYSRSHHHTFNFLFNTKQRHIRETLRHSNSEYIHELSLSYIYIYTMEYTVWYGRPHFHRHRHHCHNAILLMDRAPHHTAPATFEWLAEHWPIIKTLQFFFLSFHFISFRFTYNSYSQYTHPYLCWHTKIV